MLFPLGLPEIHSVLLKVWIVSGVTGRRGAIAVRSSPRFRLQLVSSTHWMAVILMHRSCQGGTHTRNREVAVTHSVSNRSCNETEKHNFSFLTDWYSLVLQLREFRDVHVQLPDTGARYSFLSQARYPILTAC